MGGHFLLQSLKLKSESEVAQSCLTLGDPMDYSLPGSSIHGILQARVLEWGAINQINHILLLLSRVSHVRLCVTPKTAAQQAPLSLGFSRQEHWSGLPFPSPVMKVKSESEVAQSCLTLGDPMDYSPPGSLIPGILQLRVLEWGAIAIATVLDVPKQDASLV